MQWVKGNGKRGICSPKIRGWKFEAKRAKLRSWLRRGFRISRLEMRVKCKHLGVEMGRNQGFLNTEEEGSLGRNANIFDWNQGEEGERRMETYCAIISWMRKRMGSYTQTIFLWNLIKWNRNQIVFTTFRWIWIQTNVRLDSNLSENGKYNLISVWINKIPIFFICV